MRDQLFVVVRVCVCPRDLCTKNSWTSSLCAPIYLFEHQLGAGPTKKCNVNASPHLLIQHWQQYFFLHFWFFSACFLRARVLCCLLILKFLLHFYSQPTVSGSIPCWLDCCCSSWATYCVDVELHVPPHSLAPAGPPPIEVPCSHTVVVHVMLSGARKKDIK